jgi:nucleotide-binding universal stress UspA family protein
MPNILSDVNLHQRLLVPLDGSVLAECVLPHVRELIRPGQTHIYLLSVLSAGVGDRAMAVMTTYPPGLQLSASSVSRVRAQIEAYLRGIAAQFRDLGASVRTEVREGNPADEIIDCARAIDAGLLIMNTHGLSGISRWVFGSVTDRVLRGAPCPVLLVRDC